MSASTSEVASMLGTACRAAKVRPSDGRSSDAVRLRKIKAELTAHIGGKPSATQRALIDRAAMLTLHLARMDAKAMETGEFSDHASRQYLAWSNSLARVLRDLGMKGAKQSQAPSLSDYISRQTAA